MKNLDRMGCLSEAGIATMIITLVVIAGYVFLNGGLLYNPGPLNARTGEPLGGVASHSEIGGNCKACHTAPWESARMEDRCQECHQTITIQLKDVSTFHGSIIENNPDLTCRHCHPEHRGPDAPLTEMTEASFPHETTGFSLRGHRFTVRNEAFVCFDCHGPDISRFEAQTCDTCHRQIDSGFMTVHSLYYGTVCLDCHDGVDRLVSEFSHDRFSFKLNGEHAGIECQKCHTGARNLVDFQIVMLDCYSCHAQDDEHEGRFGTDCGTCHNPSDWEDADFDHAMTSFPLTGQHVELACEECHDTDQFVTVSNECASCHDDPVYHAGMFGLDCAACHTTINWFAPYNGPHPGIADEGGRGVNHGGASCRDCHTQTLHTATCTACHNSNNPEGDEREDDD